MASEPIDVVYTWVDDAWPGYGELLSQHARSQHDRNPNRTRDNLELLRYSLRSLERYAPWVRRVFLVSMRPQVPAWLSPEHVQVVHHDQLFAAEHLPTFNSFAIVSHLVDVQGLSERFLYLEDDRFFMREVSLGDFVTPAGKLRLYVDGSPTPPASRRTDARCSPWDLALAQANHELDLHYGEHARPSIKRAPMFVDQGHFRRYRERFSSVLSATRQSRFRARGNVASEHMYPYYVWHEGQAEWVQRAEVKRSLGYAGLERLALFNGLQLTWLDHKRPKLVCLNDNYGHAPPRRAVSVVKHFLRSWFPEPSRFERGASSL